MQIGVNKKVFITGIPGGVSVLFIKKKTGEGMLVCITQDISNKKDIFFL